MEAKCNDHFTFELVIVSWDTLIVRILRGESVIDNCSACSDKNITSGAILPFDAVCTGSPVIIT